MFKKLQECKNLKEIFVMVGTKPFEITAFVLLILWSLLPIYWTIERVYWTLVAQNDYEHQYAIMAGHMYIMRVLGMVSLYVAVFFVITRLCVHGKNTWKKINAEPWHFLLLLMLAWGGISTLFAKDLKVAWAGDGYLGEGYRAYLYYAGVYVCAFILTKSKFKWIVMNIFNVVANIVSLTIIIVDYTDIQFLKIVFPGQLSGVFFHFNHAGYYINMGIVCAMGLYMHTKGAKSRIWYAFSIALQVFGILVNSTLGAFLGTCGALVMVLVFFVRRYSKWSIHMLTPVIIVIALVIASYFGCIPNSKGEDMRVNFQLLFSNSQSVANEGDVATIGHGRGNYWIQSLKMIPGSPIFGYGPDHLDEVYSKLMAINRPDNEFIQHAVFMGIPALLMYLTALIMLFVHQMKKMKNLDRTILIAAGCMVAYLISAQFGVSAFYTTPYLYMFFGMAAGRSFQEQESIDAGLAEIRAEVDTTLEQRLLEPKKDKKRKKKVGADTENIAEEIKEVK